MGKDKSGSKKASKTATPTLSNFLLGQTTSTLDNDIFSNSQGATTAYTAKAPVYTKRPARAAPVAVEVVEEEEEDEEDVANDAELSEAESGASLGLPSDSEGDEGGVEEAYEARMVAERLKGGNKKRKAGDAPSDDEEASDDSEDDDDDELDLDNLVHESLLPKTIFKEVKATPKDLKKAAAERNKAAKAMTGETPEERDLRTIFLGNVPVACSTSRSMKKALVRHVLQSPALLALLPANCPPLKMSTIRFRSLAFASTVFGRKPTTTTNDEGEEVPVAEAGGRGRKRARDWRNDEGTDERGVMGGYKAREGTQTKRAELLAEAAKGAKGALTDGQKRRVAFIRGELNEGKSACNAYLVLDAFPASYTALSTAGLLDILVKATDGTTFESHTLRADNVRPRSSASTLAAAQLASKPSTSATLAPPSTGASYTVPPLEARRTLFVGGLDFAESEENIRKATEEVLGREMGESGDKGWVEGVRIIRDASTGLGKGFGYVLLRNAECVDELLALPSGAPLKVSKRKVRLERCKTGVAAARAKASAATKEAKAASSKASITPTAFAPKDPSLRPRISSANTESAQQARIAEALSRLGTDERKAVKAIDPERLMRRAQKKKNKVLGERYERKKMNAEKGGGILGRETRGEERKRKEKKRVKAGNVTGKRAKKIV